MRLLIFAFFLLPFSFLQANDYPDEFADFFSETPRKILFVFAGEQKGEEFNSITTFESLSVEDASELARLRYFLTKNGINKGAIESIIIQINVGVISDPQCIGRINRCVIAPEKGQIHYVFDFDNETLKFFVAPDLIDNVTSRQESQGYHDAKSIDNGVINWSNLYAYSDFDEQSNINWSNDTVIGMPYGYVSLDSQYSSNNGDFNVYTATYDLDVKGYQARVGYDRYTPTFNSTDFLNVGLRLDSNFVSFASNDKLSRSSDASNKRIEFFAPQNALLEVYRGDRVILSKNVQQGRQQILYSELPTGAYDIKIILKANNIVVLEDSRPIVNTSRYAMPVGKSDFAITLGQFNESNYDKDQLNHDVDSFFGRALFSIRASERFMVGGGVMATGDERYYSIGVNDQAAENIYWELNAGLFSSNDSYFNMRLNLNMFSFDYRAFSLSSEDLDYRLSNQLLGTNEFSDLSVGISGNLGSGYGYMRYSLYNGGHNYDYSETSGRSNNINGGYTASLWGGALSLDANYSQYVDDNRDDFRINISWTKRFGETFSSEMSTTFDENGLSRYSHYVKQDVRGNNWSATNQAGVIYQDQDNFSSEISSNVAGNNDYINGNAYAYLNDNGTNTLSGNISGSQLLSKRGVDFTNVRGKSFAKISANYRDDESDKIEVNISRDGKYLRRMSAVKENTIVKLDEYSMVNIEGNGEGANVEIEDGKFNGFIHPGTVNLIDADILKLESILVVLDDIDGNPISHLQCVGEGCSTIENVTSDGIFRVNYRAGAPYLLVSRKGLCIYEPVAEKGYSKGYCLPGLMDSSKSGIDSAEYYSYVTDENEVYVYLGYVGSTQEEKVLLEDLKSNDIEFLNIEMSSKSHIYIYNKSNKLTDVQRNFLRRLSLSALIHDFAGSNFLPAQ